MMNDFGVPYNDAEMSMLPPGADKPHQRLKEELGVESQWVGAVVGGVIGAVGGIIGGSKSASAAKAQATAQNEAAQRQLEYDKKAWNMGKEKLGANRDHLIKEIQAKERNEKRVANFKDASNLAKYNYDMQIRNREQTSLNEQFDLSNKVYNETLGYNRTAAHAGFEDEIRALEQTRAEAAFDTQEIDIEFLLAEGKSRARTASGRTGRKVSQAIHAVPGLALAQLSASLTAGTENANRALAGISTEWRAADIAAEAQKMLDPGTLPSPIVPFATPMAEFVMPRALQEFDFGPEPVLGAMANVSAAGNAAWGSAISGIAGSVGSAVASTSGRSPTYGQPGGSNW